MEDFEAIFFKNIDNNNIYYLVCEEGKEVIAFGSIHIRALLHHCSNIGEIGELIVKNGLRSKGIGSKLVKELIRVGKEQGCSLIEVCCNPKRPKSLDFYEANGFSKTHFKYRYQEKKN